MLYLKYFCFAIGGVNMKNTIVSQEFKVEEGYIGQKAREHYENHKQFFENWQEGGVETIWTDTEGNICIQYESGKWWHYNEEGEWW